MRQDEEAGPRYENRKIRSFPRHCVCSQCGYELERPPEVPCYLMRCPRCESQMVNK